MMSKIEIAMREHALSRAHHVAIDDGMGRTLTWLTLASHVERRVQAFRELGVETLGIYCDNGIEWILSDLAAHIAGISTVPIPKFFTPSQVHHVTETAGIDSIVTDEIKSVEAQGFVAALRLTEGGAWFARRSDAPRVGVRFQKVTFTSGTTGEPKGVCLERDHLEIVADVLREASGTLASDVHLCCLPLSVMLENIAGVYRSILAGGKIVVPPLAEVGLQGAQQFDPAIALDALRKTEATSAILVPEMLKGLVAFSGADAATCLRHIGVGGARVSPPLLHAAMQCGLPAFEGYGLSEFASVVSVNRPGATQVGSSGRPLPHVEVRISESGEIEVRGPHYLGYLGTDGFTPPRLTDDGFLRTGDIGEIDDGGFVRVTGRARNVLISSFGRNISPEWVESELLANPLVAQAVVFGNDEPTLSAVIVVRMGGGDIQAHIANVNARLPDYARIGKCIVTDVPLAEHGGLTQQGGGIAREAVALHFGQTKTTAKQEGKEEPWAFTTVS